MMLSICSAGAELEVHLRLEQLFLQREIDFLQARLHLLQSIDRLIDDDDAKGRRRRIALAVGHREVNRPLLARLVFALVGLHVDLQIVA